MLTLFENLATGIAKYDDVNANDAVVAFDAVPNIDPVNDPVIKLEVNWVNVAIEADKKLPDNEMKFAKLLVIIENWPNDPEMLPVIPKLALTLPTKLPVILPFNEPVIETKSASVPTILPVTLPVKLPTTAVVEIFSTDNVLVFGLYSNPISDFNGFTPLLSAKITYLLAFVESPPKINELTDVVANDAVPVNVPNAEPVNDPVNKPWICPV